MRRLSKLSLHDALAGLSVAIVLVPQSLAYAQIAGMPAYRGLYAAAIPPLVAAPFASSPYLQPGPTAVSALLTHSALTPLAQVGSARYMELGLLLALMVGAIRVGVGLARWGFVAYLLSQPLLLGFVPAAAILIIASQLPVIFGSPAQGHHELYGAASALINVGQWRTSPLLVATAVAVSLLLGRRLHPLFPTVLVAVVAAIAFSKLSSYSGATLGDIRSGLPPLTTSLSFEDAPKLVFPALTIALIGFAEAAAIARTYATLERKRWDASREFLSQGVANIAAAAAGGFPVGASFSRSALNRLAGAKTNLSGLVTGLVVLALLPFAFVLAPLPKSALAATVIVAVIPLIRIGQVMELARISRAQLAITLAAFFMTLALAPHLDRAIVGAVLLSILIHLWRELALDVSAGVADNRLQLAPQGVLWFGSARVLEDRFGELIADHPNVSRLDLHLGGLGRIDLTGALALKRLIEDARGAGLTITVTDTPRHASRILGRVMPDETQAAKHPLGSPEG